MSLLTLGETKAARNTGYHEGVTCKEWNLSFIFLIDIIRCTCDMSGSAVNACNLCIPCICFHTHVFMMPPSLPPVFMKVQKAVLGGAGKFEDEP